MHKIINFKNINIDSVNFINLSISFMPFLYILGAPWMEIPVLISAIYLIYYIIQNFTNKQNQIIFNDKLNLIFILLFIFIVFLSSFLSQEKTSILKSLAYFRYVFFYLYIINFYDDKSFKKLVSFSFFSISFVIFDIFFQFIFGKDLFGITPGLEYTRYQGPFGDELISGSFFKYFFFISLCFYLFDKQILKIIFSILSVVVVILSGEKSNLILFVFGIGLISIFDLRKNLFFLVTIFVTLLSIFIIIFNLTKINSDNDTLKRIKNLQNRYGIHLLNSVGFKIKNEEGKKLNNSFKNSPHVIHFISAYEIFKKNMLFGVGIKNFRKECKNLDIVKYSEIHNLNYEQFQKYRCSNHPHNKYLEILSETGLFGFLFFVLILLRIFYKFLTNILLNKKNVNNLIITLFLFVFPFATTGSFFTNKNSIFFWMILSIVTLLINKTDHKT